MTEPEAQEKLREIAAGVEEIRSRLLEIHDGLPIPPNEGLMLVGEAEMDVSTEVRSVIECVLNDNIDPAIRNLLAAAEYKGNRHNREDLAAAKEPSGTRGKG